jgi:hypothetical protein
MVSIFRISCLRGRTRYLHRCFSDYARRTQNSEADGTPILCD